ncbi:hypothetical protein SORBI_3001G331700, partial [Sorghum bicolor]
MQNGGRWRSGNKQGEEREEIAWMAQFSERQDRKSSHSAAAAVLSLPPFCPPTFQPSKKPPQSQRPRRATPKGTQEAVILLPRKKLRSST